MMSTTSTPLGHILLSISFIGIAAAAFAAFCFYLYKIIYPSPSDARPNHRGKKKGESYFTKFITKFMRKFNTMMAPVVTYCSFVMDSRDSRFAALGVVLLSCFGIATELFFFLSTTQPKRSPSLELENLMLSFIRDCTTISPKGVEFFAYFCGHHAFIIETWSGTFSPLRFAALIPGVALGICLLKFLLLSALYFIAEDLAGASGVVFIYFVVIAMLPIFATPAQPRLHFNICCWGIIVGGVTYWLAQWVRTWDPSLCEFVIVFTCLVYYCGRLLRRT